MRVNQREPYILPGKKWFYLARACVKCSFHDGTTNQHVHDIPLKAIMLALQDRGLLAQWDTTRRRFKPTR